MVRNYKPKPGHRRYKKYDPEIMKKAYRDFANGEGSLANIAKKYDIAKSCLYRRIHQKVPVKDTGGQRAFTLEREEHIMKYIHACAPWQYNIQFWDIRLLIKFYLDRRPVITKRKFINNLPGQELVYKFIKRHEDSIPQKVIQSLNDNGEVSAEAILSYFHELRMLINDLDPQNIVCFNDLVINDDNEEKDINTANSKMYNIFLMMAASASGEILDPYITHKDKSCYENNHRKSIMPNHLHQKRKKLNVGIFEDWFKTVIVPYFQGKPGKKCLIGNFFSSRVSKDILEICNEQNINFVFLPDNSNTLTQPLHFLTHVIQTSWSSLLPQTKKVDHVQFKILKDGFCEMTKHLMVSSRDSIKEGFGKTGINPFNPVEVLKQLPDYNETTIEELDEDFEKRDEEVQEHVEIKQEMEWSDQYDDNDNSDEEDARYFLKKETSNVKDESSDIKTQQRDFEINLTKLELKTSPVDFQEGMTSDDALGNVKKENSNSVRRSSRGRKLKIKRGEEYSSDSDYALVSEKEVASTRHAKNKSRDGEIVTKRKIKDSSNRTEIDPLSSYQSTANLRTNETYCENGTCDTHTRLLEEILATVKRQENLQERAAIAMESQALALSNIAMLLKRQSAGNTAT